MTRRAQARLGIVLTLPVAVLVLCSSSSRWSVRSTTRWSTSTGWIPTPAFVGFDNFTEMFTDPAVWAALRNNAIWIVVGTAAPMILGLLIAVLIWSVRRGSAIYRLIFFLPFVLPAVAIGIVWTWIYDPVDGSLNRALEAIGLGSLTRGWLGDPDLALYAVLATAVWGATAFVIMIFLSALRNVDAELRRRLSDRRRERGPAVGLHHRAADHAGVPDGA